MSNLEIPEPQIIEELSFNEILQKLKQQLLSLDDSYSAFVESDPIVKLLEVSAYNELLLRHRINQVARANLLAFASGSDLDNLAMLYGLERKSGETDEEFRGRIRARIEGFSTAGSREAYKYHALNADTRVKEANADSPAPGLVRVSILSKENGGMASDDLLANVNKHLQREDIRMLTDTVEVVACDLIDLNIDAKIFLMTGTPVEFLANIKASFIKSFNAIAGLGVPISRSWIISNLFLDGVKDVQLLQPLQDVAALENECVRLSSINLKV